MITMKSAWWVPIKNVRAAPYGWYVNAHCYTIEKFMRDLSGESENTSWRIDQRSYAQNKVYVYSDDLAVLLKLNLQS